MMLRKSTLFAAVAFAAATLFATDARAQRTADVPVQVGVGPAGNMFGGPTLGENPGFGGGLFEDQPIHTGLRFNITAVIDWELVRRHRRLVPRQYHSQVRQAGEVRYRPGILAVIPTSIYLSPPLGDAQAWGATWSLLGLGLPLMSEPFRPSISGSVIASLMYIDSESASSPYFFVRPGVELQLDIEFPIDDNFLISLGWASKVYVPQALQGTPVDVGGFDEDSLWHIGQFYVQGHFRIPYSYRYR